MHARQCVSDFLFFSWALPLHQLTQAHALHSTPHENLLPRLTRSELPCGVTLTTALSLSGETSITMLLARAWAVERPLADGLALYSLILSYTFCSLLTPSLYVASIFLKITNTRVKLSPGRVMGSHFSILRLRISMTARAVALTEYGFELPC